METALIEIFGYSFTGTEVIGHNGIRYGRHFPDDEKHRFGCAA